MPFSNEEAVTAFGSRCYCSLLTKWCLLFFVRPVGSGSCLTPVRTLSFPLNGGGSTLTHNHVENMDVNDDNVCFEHSTRSMEELVSPLESTTTAENGSSSPLFEKVKLQENLPCSSSSNSLVCFVSSYRESFSTPLLNLRDLNVLSCT